MTGTYISDEMVEAAATHLEIDFDGDEPFIRLDSINAALEAIAPALIREGMKRAAEVAYVSPHYIKGPLDDVDENGLLRPGSPYDRGRYDAATAIRTAAEEV